MEPKLPTWQAAQIWLTPAPALAHGSPQVLAAHRILSAPVVVGNGGYAGGSGAEQQVDKAPEVCVVCVRVCGR